MITTPISPLNGLARTCSIGQIAYMDFKIKEAKIRFDVTITDLNITKSFWSHISNANRVTEAGVMVTREYAESIFVPQITREAVEVELGASPEVDEALAKKVSEEFDLFYQELLEEAITEFDFWWAYANQATLEVSLIEGIKLLDSFGFFNPKQADPQ